MCNLMGYIQVIKNFRHKGLEDFFIDGSKRGIQPNHARKLADILDRLDAAEVAEDMNFPGADMHLLKGNLKGHWAVRVSGNWRIIFMFYEGNAYVVDYVDYH